MDPNASHPGAARHADATRVLSQLGQRAMPDVSHVADAHLAAMTQARLAGGPARVRATARSGRRRRALVVSVAAAAIFVVPSLALAGALPDPVQHVAAQVASTVGIELPDPPKAPPARPDRPAADAAAETAATDEAGRERRDADSPGNDPREGTGRPVDPGRTLPDGSPVPGKGRPAEGEQRGTRTGQADDRPSRGNSAQSSGRPGGGSQGQKPTAPPPRSTTPPAPSAGGSGGNAGGNAGSVGNGGSGGSDSKGRSGR